MDHENREKIKKILSEAGGMFKESLLITDLLQHLKRQGVLKNWDVDAISRQKTNGDKVDKLLEKLRLKPASAYDAFVEILNTQLQQNEVYQKVKVIEAKYKYHSGQDTTSSTSTSQTATQTSYGRPAEDTTSRPKAATQPKGKTTPSISASQTHASRGGPTSDTTDTASRPSSALRDVQMASDSDFSEVAKQLTPDELKHLYDALNGITRQEVEKAIEAAATLDVDLQAKSVFRKWSMLNGSAATRYAILDALLYCKFQNAVEKLRKIWAISLDDYDSANQDTHGSRRPSPKPDAGANAASSSSTPDTSKQSKSASTSKGHMEQIEHPLFGNDSILLRCREELKAHYMNSLCKIPLFPGDMSKCVDLKDIYTKVSIVMDLPKPCSSIRIPLKSHEEIFTRKTDDGQFYTRLLLAGPAGYGKTTTTAKIAYDWAKSRDLFLSDIGLLFVVNMRWVEHTSNLEDVILSQMLPDDTEMTKELLRSKIKELRDRVIIIVDAVDESDRELFNHPKSSGSIVKLLTGKTFVLCRLVVTTRPWRVVEIVKACKAFTRLDLSGFSKEDVQTYIRQFFRDDEELRESLLEYMSQNALVADVSRVPLMALLVSTYWRKSRAAEIPNRIGHLYDAILNIMYKHFQSKPRKPQAEVRETRGKKLLRFLKLKKYTTEKEVGIDFTLLRQHLGKMALEGLWPPENRIVFSVNEVADPEVVEEACQMGLVSKQEMRVGQLHTLHNATFASAETASNATKLTFFISQLKKNAPVNILQILPIPNQSKFSHDCDRLQPYKRPSVSNLYYDSHVDEILKQHNKSCRD
ncbi:uncharacterized protein [Amphiura filiformis]|uniref:uncharacterized protein n=1 Tax=Amphiura filiformis TaxID=82378 RepID=UPI003B2239E4